MNRPWGLSSTLRQIKNLLSVEDFQGLLGPIILDQFEGRTLQMSVQELREAFEGIPGAKDFTISYASNGNQIVHAGDKLIEIGPMAGHEEIRLALLNPTVKTENTKVIMVSPLQGLGQKFGKLKHDAEIDASKLGARIDELSGRKDRAVARSHQFLDGHEHDIKDIESFVSEVEQATNGGPA